MFRNARLLALFSLLLVFVGVFPAAAQDAPPPNPAEAVFAALPPGLAIITPDAALVPLAQLDQTTVRALAANFLTPETPANQTWLVQAVQSGIFISGGGQISFDGTLVAAYQSGRGIMIANTLTNETISSFGADLALTDLAFDAADDLLVVSLAEGLQAFDSQGNPLDLPQLAAASDFAYSPAGGLGDGVSAVANNDGRVDLYYGDLRSAQPLGQVDTVTGAPVMVRLDRTGTWLVAYNGGGIVGIWNVGTLQPLPVPTSRAGLTAQEFDLLGRTLAVANQPGQVDLVDLVSGSAFSSLDAGADPVRLVSFSPDGRLLLTFAGSDIVQLWGAVGTDEPVVESPPAATLAFDATALPPPADLATAEATAEATEAAQVAVEPTAAPTFTPLPPPACTLTTRGDTNVRAQPTTNSERTGLIAAGQQVAADGQARDGGNVRWYHLATGDWVRADLVAAGEGCTELPTLQ